MNRNLNNAISIYSDLFKKYGLFRGIIKLIYLTLILIKRNSIWNILRLKKSVIKDIRGNKMLLDFRGVGFDISSSSIIKQLALDGAREVEATNIMEQILQEGQNVLDIGANIGYYVLIEAKAIKGKGKVYAIEPEPKNLAILKKNIYLNNYADVVELFPLAISDKEGKVRLDISAFSNRHILSSSDKSNNAIEVSSTTIDLFLRNRQKPDIIRMDIEGAEYLAINGAKNTLSGSKNLKLFIEIHPKQIRKLGGDSEGLLNTLKELNFKIRAVIFYDRNIRSAVGFTKATKPSFEDLINNKSLLSGAEAFEAFFEK